MNVTNTDSTSREIEEEDRRTNEEDRDANKIATIPTIRELENETLRENINNHHLLEYVEDSGNLSSTDDYMENVFGQADRPMRQSIDDYNVTENEENTITWSPIDGCSKTEASPQSKIINKVPTTPDIFEREIGIFQENVLDNTRIKNTREFTNLSFCSQTVKPQQKKDCIDTNVVGNDSTTEYCGIISPLPLHSFKVVKISADGNCLFRALSFALYQDESNHKIVRQKIVEYVEDNFDDEKDILHATRTTKKFKTAEKYKKYMSQNAVYGSDFEIAIFSKIYNKRIILWRMRNANYVLIGPTTPENYDGDIHILFSGSKSGGHYDYLDDNNLHQNIYDVNKNRELKNTHSSHNNYDSTAEQNDIMTKVMNNDTISPDFSSSDDDDSIQIESNTKTVSDGETSPCDTLQNEDTQEFDDDTDEKYEDVQERRNIYTIDNGMIEILTEEVVIDGKINTSLLRLACHKALEQENFCQCRVRFYGSLRSNVDGSWVMYGRCSVSSHDAKMKFEIFLLSPHTIRVHVSSNVELNYRHHDEGKPICRPIRGEERRKMLLRLNNRSSRDVQLELMQQTDPELLADGYGQCTHSLHVYDKIKSEARCAQRKHLISRDIEDVLQSYIEDAQNTDPFIRQVTLPLQILMYSSAQLNTINIKNPIIVHLDSTGANVRTPSWIKKGAIFYYCLIYRATKASIPIAQMITSQHTIPSISIFLKQYRAFVKREINTWPIKAIVTDWSWALMNSILFEWNEMNVTKYLECTYNYVTDGIIPLNKTILLSCCAHTMHRVKRTLKKSFPKLIKIKSFILDCVALLVLCKNIEKMSDVYNDMMRIMLVKRRESMKNAFTSMCSQKYEERKHFEDIEAESIETDEEELELEDEFLRMYGKSSAIYAKSPYFKYFWKLLTEAQKRTSEEESDVDEITNEYYAPEFAEFLTGHFMPFCPIWSGLMIDLVDPNISRVSNAYVESHNRAYKERILKGRKLNAIGDVCRALKQYTQYLVTEEEIERIKIEKQSKDINVLRGRKRYIDQKVENQDKKLKKTCKKQAKKETRPPQSRRQPTEKEQKKITIKERPSYPEEASNPFQQEVWGRSKSDLSTQTTKKKRYAHMEGKHIIRICRKLTEENNSDDDSENTSMTTKKKDEQSVKNVAEDTEVMLCTEESDSSNTEGEQKIKKGNDSNNKKVLHTLKNGLVSDVLYYLLSNSNRIIISIYKARDDCTVAFKKFYMKASNFKCLAHPNSWIDDAVVDSYMACNMEKWNNVTYFPTDVGTTVLGQFWRNKHSSELKPLNIRDPIKEMLLLPYYKDAHWRLLVVNCEKHELTLMDPYEKTYDRKNVQAAFKKFIRTSNAKSTMKKLEGIDWQMVNETNRPYQKVNNTSDCALYIIHYMECLGNKQEFNKDFEPEVFRKHVAETLIIKSDNVMEKCLHCMRDIGDAEKYLCKICNRWIHQRCVTINTTDSDNEDKNISTKSEQRTKETLTKFECCRLCLKYLKHR